MTGLLLTLALIPVFWFLLVRPQQQRQRDHQAVVASVTVGDEVVTAGGIVGKVTATDGEIVTVEVAPGTELRIVRSYVVQRIDDRQVGSPLGDREDEEMTNGVDRGAQ